MGKRSSDIKALIRRGEIDLKKIEQAYASALYQKIIPSDLQIDIKNFCENQRSVLDYLAHDIREMYCPGANSTDRFYFPICGDARQFEGDVAKSYPGLKAVSPDLWGFLESIQPYHSEWSWLGAFNKLNNENKHGRLVAQKRQETPQVTASRDGGGVVSWLPNQVRFGSGVRINGVPVDPRTQMPVPDASLKIERVVWVDFRFDGTEISALALIREVSSGVRKLVDIAAKWV